MYDFSFSIENISSSTTQFRLLKVIPVLWNGAVMDELRSINLVWDDAKLDSYINNALRVFDLWIYM